MGGEAGDVPKTAPIRLVQSLQELWKRGDFDGIEALIHPACEMRIYLAPDRVLRGPREVRAALEEAADSLFDVRQERYDDLGEGWVLVVGSVRMGEPGTGVRQQTAAWLFEVVDDLVKTTIAFPGEQDARSHVEQLRGSEAQRAGEDPNLRPTD